MKRALVRANLFMVGIALDAESNVRSPSLGDSPLPTHCGLPGAIASMCWIGQTDLFR